MDPSLHPGTKMIYKGNKMDIVCKCVIMEEMWILHWSLKDCHHIGISCKSCDFGILRYTWLNIHRFPSENVYIHECIYICNRKSAL